MKAQITLTLDLRAGILPERILLKLLDMIDSEQERDENRFPADVVEHDHKLFQPTEEEEREFMQSYIERFAGSLSPVDLVQVMKHNLNFKPTAYYDTAEYAQIEVLARAVELLDERNAAEHLEFIAEDRRICLEVHQAQGGTEETFEYYNSGSGSVVHLIEEMDHAERREAGMIEVELDN